MRQVDARALAQPAERLRFLHEFVGFSADDRAAMTESLAVLGPHLPRILDQLYDFLLDREDTRRIFLGAQLEIDPIYIAQRKEHLTEWVLMAAAGSSLDELAAYMVKVAGQHVGRESPHRAVPPRYIVAMTSRLQAAFATALFASLPAAPQQALRMTLAWSKFLVVHLEMFLHAIAPSWPNWDEMPSNGNTGRYLVARSQETR